MNMAVTPGEAARIQVIDSHTAGEPTRVVVAGGPDLGFGSLAEQLDKFRTEFDWFRSAVVNEPRGSDVIVGALLTEPVREGSTAGMAPKLVFHGASPPARAGSLLSDRPLTTTP